MKLLRKFSTLLDPKKIVKTNPLYIYDVLTKLLKHVNSVSLKLHIISQIVESIILYRDLNHNFCKIVQMKLRLRNLMKDCKLLHIKTHFLHVTIYVLTNIYSNY